jgi:hypothetical protein
MKNTIIISLIGLFTLGISNAQTHDTLRNLSASAPLIDWMMTGNTQGGTTEWGSFLGHNTYGDEAFGEKYTNVGNAQIAGIVAHHRGHASGSNNEAWYRIHQVGPNGLPGSAIGGKKIKLSDIDRSGEPFLVIFDSPVNVTGDFFVMWDLMDYSHGTQLGDTLRLLAGEDGSRPTADHVNFGRNVVRWHSHGATPAWKDFFTQNFSPFSIYFGIYPIVVNTATAQSEIPLAENLSYYPQPCNALLNLNFSSKEAGNFTIEFIGLDGKKYEQRNVWLQQGENTFQFDLAHLPSGNFIAILRKGKFQSARLLIKV